MHFPCGVGTQTGICRGVRVEIDVSIGELVVARMRAEMTMRDLTRNWRYMALLLSFARINFGLLELLFT